MALFGPKPLPLTSYGYLPPRGVTIKGWKCTNRESCGTGDDVPPTRWPVRCPECGCPCDPTFNEPWAHDALGVELNWQIRNDPDEYGRKFARERLMAWELKDALRRRDGASVAAARSAMHGYMQHEIQQSAWNPGLTLFLAICDGLEQGDLDGAASDLVFWLRLPPGEPGANSSRLRSNVSQLVNLSDEFLSAPGGAAHPQADEIRQGCLRAAASCYSDLSRDIQDKVVRMSSVQPGRAASQRQDTALRTAAKARGDRISSAQLADFGRFSFLGAGQSGIKATDSLDLVRPLAELAWSQDLPSRAIAIAELRRHAAKGEWEAVGAWKVVREFMDDAPETATLIDGGLSAIIRMRVTNLAIHLAPVDIHRYQALAGGPPPNDGFFGPPVFDSHFGPARQYYLDSAVAAAARRTTARLPHAPGVQPGPAVEAARAMWDFGQLIYRGPLVVNPDIAFEPSVVLRAVNAATNTDHALFLDAVADAIADPENYLTEGYATLGAARFAEDYLTPEALTARGYQQLIDNGLTRLIRTGEPGLMISPLLLTPIQQDRLAQLRAVG
jgi:hypothetical protein